MGDAPFSDAAPAVSNEAEGGTDLEFLLPIDRGRARWHGVIAAMTRRGHDPIAKFIRWLEDARRARIPNYEAMALATAARSGKTSVHFVLLKRERFEL